MKEMWCITDDGKPIAVFGSKKEAHLEFEIMDLGSCYRFQIQSSSECDENGLIDYTYIRKMMIQEKVV